MGKATLRGACAVRNGTCSSAASRAIRACAAASASRSARSAALASSRPARHTQPRHAQYAEWGERCRKAEGLNGSWLRCGVTGRHGSRRAVARAVWMRDTAQQHGEKAAMLGTKPSSQAPARRPESFSPSAARASRAVSSSATARARASDSAHWTARASCARKGRSVARRVRRLVGRISVECE